MKKIIKFSFLIALVFFISSCSNDSEKTATYYGDLIEKVKTKDNTIIISLSGVEADKSTKDPIIFDDNGVILNAEEKSIDDLDNLKNADEGTKIKFIVKVPTTATQSIPPQIPGDQIKTIEVIK